MSQVSLGELLFADPVQHGAHGDGEPLVPRPLAAWLSMVTGRDMELASGELLATDGHLITLPNALPRPLEAADAAIFRVAALGQAGLVALGLLEQRPFIARMHRDWLLRTAWTQLAVRAVLSHYARELPGVARDLRQVQANAKANRLMLNTAELPRKGLPGLFEELLSAPAGAVEPLALMGQASSWRERLAAADLGPCPTPWYLGVLRPEWLLESRELDLDWQKGQKPLRLLRRAMGRLRRGPELPDLNAPSAPERLSTRREWRSTGWAEVRVVESIARGGALSSWDRIVGANQQAARALQRRFAALRSSPRWRGGQLDGSEVDLDRALIALADMRAGNEPDRRLYRRFVRPPLPLAVQTLVDLSGSTTGAVLHAQQQAVVLLALALEALGAPNAFTGFNGAEGQVHLHGLKGFDEGLDEGPRKRLGNLRAGGSSRLGAVVRHCAEALARRPEPRRLLLLLSDGRPEARDYGGSAAMTDTALAVREARRRGLHVHCVSLDARDTRWLRPLFGEHHLALRRVEELAERLPELIARLH